MAQRRDGCSWALWCFVAGFPIGWTVERILTGYGLRAFFAIYDPGPTLGGIIGGILAAVIGFTIGNSGDTPAKTDGKTAPPDHGSDLS